jgi:hypothetical protein
MFITFRKKVMKPNPLRGMSNIIIRDKVLILDISAVRRIVFSRFHPETVKEKRKSCKSCLNSKIKIESTPS